jgi:Protein of unknown function (DUF3467)
MAKKEDNSSKENKAGSNPTPGSTELKIRWDSSDTRSAYANHFNVIVTREEMTLCFGLKQALDDGQKEGTVHLSNGIVLNPFAAKRFVTVLNNVLQDYESKYGPLKGESPQSSDLEQIPSLSEKPPFSEKAGLLFYLIKNLNIDYGFERSFKISEKALLGNRFLFTMSKHAIRQDPHGRILNICRRMDMPKKLLEVYDENLPSANYVHFGFEEDEKSYVYKAYLEFWTDWENEIKNKPNRFDPFLVHLGFKWDVSEPTRCVVTRYICHPSLSVDNILERISKVFDRDQYRTPCEIAKGIVRLASSRISHDKILYVEVEEENNPRRSFDMNMYKAKLRLEELHSLLLDMCRHYSIPSEEFHILYDQFRTKLFGHLSGGIDREGKDFLTIYYGVEGH